MNRHETSIDIAGRIGQDVHRVMQCLPVGSAKIFGSALTHPETAGDVDIAVCEIRTYDISALLHASIGTRVHVLPLPPDTFHDLHNVLSWKNCLVTATSDGHLTYGDEYLDGAELHFNPRSRAAFPSFRSAVKAATKMAARGYDVPASERARASVILAHHHEALDTLVREALGEDVVHLLAAHGAVVAGGFLRDEIDGRPPKDLDVFVPAGGDWEGLCGEIGGALEEVDFEKPEGRKRVNLRKFAAKSRCPGHERLIVDVIDYGFVHEGAHVVETFDFAHNMLWWDPAGGAVRGSKDHDAGAVVRSIRERKLVVGNNLWYRASAGRAMKRWQRFRRDGYVADAKNIELYSSYVKELMMGKRCQRVEDASS